MKNKTALIAVAGIGVLLYMRAKGAYATALANASTSTTPQTGGAAGINPELIDWFRTAITGTLKYKGSL